MQEWVLQNSCSKFVKSFVVHASTPDGHLSHPPAYRQDDRRCVLHISFGSFMPCRHAASGQAVHHVEEALSPLLLLGSQTSKMVSATH